MEYLIILPIFGFSVLVVWLAFPGIFSEPSEASVRLYSQTLDDMNIDVSSSIIIGSLVISDNDDEGGS